MTGASAVERRVDGGMAFRFRAMASPCEILVDGSREPELRELGVIAARECRRVESKWSRYLTGNVVQRINEADGRAIEVDEETARLIDFGARLHAESDGRFDLTSGVLRRLWKFVPGSAPPAPADVKTILQHIGWHRVRWRSPILQMPPGMEIDFGGIGKEYAVDRVLLLLAAATDKAILVNLGGDLAARGRRGDGAPWRVGIDSGVAGASSPLVRLNDGAVATSGDQHRCIHYGGKRYGHILDARTGWPPEGAPRCVTVARSTCVEAGALATLGMLHGSDAERWLVSQQADFHVVR